MSLQDKLDAMRESFESKLPPEIVNPMHQATEELLQSDIIDRHGTIIHAHAHPDYTKRPEPTDIVSILNSNG